MADQRNVLRLRRARIVGLGLILVMGFLIFGLVFLSEPTQIVIIPNNPMTPEDEEVVITIPTFPPDFGVPIPTFEPETLSVTPIVTLIDDLGNKDVTRGETTFLSQFTGLEITRAGTNATYDNGRIQIDLEFETDTTEPILISGTYFLQVDPVGFFARTSLTQTQTVDGIATIQIYDVRVDQVAIEDGENKIGYVLKNLNVIFRQPDIPQIVQLSPLLIPDFGLSNPVVIYNVTFNNAQAILVEEQIVNGSGIEIVADVTEDIPFVPCPLPVKADSISILFPSIGVSGTSDLWDKTPEGFDIINVDIRNNRNCDLTLAVGSQWQRVNGEILKSDIEEFLVTTNSTQPFASLPFDGNVDCLSGTGTCSGQEITWCFIAKATVDDVTEIVDPFCGKKFYR
ncbi:MAG: hypothetical protein KJI69_04015 [Patescibacteria group bacterium]|nr:hypothetical protein [Patescibacteria group bacterium]